MALQSCRREDVPDETIDHAIDRNDRNTEDLQGKSFKHHTMEAYKQERVAVRAIKALITVFLHWISETVKSVLNLLQLTSDPVMALQ